jgi:hypothetical protein
MQALRTTTTTWLEEDLLRDAENRLRRPVTATGGVLTAGIMEGVATTADDDDALIIGEEDITGEEKDIIDVDITGEGRRIIVEDVITRDVDSTIDVVVPTSDTAATTSMLPPTTTSPETPTLILLTALPLLTLHPKSPSDDDDDDDDQH